jgi:23S rRNA (uridine2552-2'-O)-methyltransferase
MRTASSASGQRSPPTDPTAKYQRKDALHQRAKREGYRSRAAYKLLEIQQAHRLLRPGDRVADLGCWPGGWLQVASELVGARGRVVGVDVAALDPPLELANVIAIRGDLLEPTVAAAILDALGGPADVLLSDAAPKLTGIRDTDRAREEALLEAVAAQIPKLLRPGGRLLLKLMDGPEADALARRIRRGFAQATSFRPGASRKGTSERYLLAAGYRGPES